MPIPDGRFLNREKNAWAKSKKFFLFHFELIDIHCKGSVWIKSFQLDVAFLRATFITFVCIHTASTS